MKIAQFKPVVGETYDIANMTLDMKGIFKGFIRKFQRSSDTSEPYFYGSLEKLLLFEIVRPEGRTGYKYAAAHVLTNYDSFLGVVSFTLSADHFGNTVEEIDRFGPQRKVSWGLIEMGKVG